MPNKQNLPKLWYVYTLMISHIGESWCEELEDLLNQEIPLLSLPQGFKHLKYSNTLHLLSRITM